MKNKKKKKKGSKIFRRNVILSTKVYIENSCNRLEIYYRRCNATNSASLRISWFFSSCDKEESGAFLPVCLALLLALLSVLDATMTSLIRVPHFQ